MLDANGANDVLGRVGEEFTTGSQVTRWVCKDFENASLLIGIHLGKKNDKR